MKKLVKRVLKLFILTFLPIVVLNIHGDNMALAQTTDNVVPDYYYANYKFNDDWIAIMDWFSDVEALYSIDQEIESYRFEELSEHFDKVFPNLSRDFSSTYQKCSVLAKSLAKKYTYSNMESLMGNSCRKSLNQVIDKINSSYRVIPVATATPSNGNAPLSVTFDARNSTDPSLETIPANNFYWYYRDEKGVDRPIGEGQVVNYTFNEPGKFIVHLVARSSNVDLGFIDGEKNLTINVTPKAADIVVYANTRKMSVNTPLKIGISEGEKGVVFDGTLTKAKGGTKILSHKWTISNYADSFYMEKTMEGSPSFINVKLSGKGMFKVTLSITDNQNNTASESYNIFLSDPVTSIKQTPENGNTSTTFIFDGSASYSISNKINTYVREIFDDDRKDIIIMAQGKKINMNTNKAIKPGNYVVRLTVTDMVGNQNVETKNLYIESSTPEPQFTITPTHKRKYPSEFTLDASNTIDNDVYNGVDSLSYSRRFSTDKYKIITGGKNNEKIVVQFDEIGKFIVTLTAIDQYGKFDSISKTIEVKSVLRPEIVIHPGPVHFGTNVDFESIVDKEIWDYTWDFGDGTPVINSQQATNTNHIYGKRGVYSVQLTVSDNNDDTNTVTEKAFIGEIKQPIAAYRIIDDKGFYIQTSEICEIEGGNAVEAYSVDRYAKVTINPSISVNTKGTSVGLQYAFEKESIAGVEKARSVSQFLTSFSDVGCHYVDLSVKDSNVGKQDKVRIWFKVKNALPSIKNLTLTFPQYEGNTDTIGFSMYNNSNNVAFDCSGSNNLTIKVTAVDPNDSDGNISRLRFYYYNVDDPDRILEYKEAWASTPYAYFVIPRIAGEYKFGVMVYDNDGGMINSEEYLAGNPSIYFPASCGETGVPVVTLKVSSTNIQVGDSVEYSIISKISTNNDDFRTDRTFYYDFDGDGVWDLTTKKDKVSYTFKNSYEEGVTPRAAVEYRGKLGKADGPTILVRNGIRPILLYNTIGNTVIFRDMSVGTIQQREICFETRECDLGNNSYKKSHIVTLEPDSLTGGTETSITKNDSFIRKYDNEGKHNVSIYLKSKYGIEVKTGFTVTTSLNSNNGRIAPGINMITLPEMTQTNGNLEIFLVKEMNNTLLIYINNESEDICYVDTDIATDGKDGDGKTDNDMDILCNKIAKIKYEPDYESAVGRLYFTNNGKLTFKNFYVTFEGIVLELDGEKKEIYDDITRLVNGIEDLSIENTDLKRSLDKLRKNLNNSSEVASLVMLINDQLNEGVQMTMSQKELLDSVLSRLSLNGDIEVTTVGMNEYEKNKREILALLSEKGTLKKTVQKKFEDFEGELSDIGLEDRKDRIEDIWNLILQENKKDSGGVDEWLLNSYFCNIYDYYSISSYTSKCGVSTESSTISENYDEGKSKTQTESQSSGLPMWLKIILIILVGGLLTMCGIIIFFSIKARLNSMSESDGDE